MALTFNVFSSGGRVLLATMTFKTKELFETYAEKARRAGYVLKSVEAS